MDTAMRHVGPARRSLFGPVNQEQLRRELSQRLRDITERDCSRWNFDFQRDRPLSGRFQWEEVPAGCAAAFYAQERTHGPRRGRSENAESEGAEERLRPRGGEEERREEEERDHRASDQENCPRVSNASKSCPVERTPARRKRARSKSAAGAPQNTRITDFFVKRRRSTETKRVLSPVFCLSTDNNLRTLR